jgi:hypothetical protein
MGGGSRLKGVYGKPWSKLVGQKVDLTPEVMNTVGRIILESVQFEVRKAAALASGLKGRGKPVPMPTSSSFVESFEYRILGSRTIEVVSDWPYAKVWEEGKKPYPMTWLTGLGAAGGYGEDKAPFKTKKPGKVLASKYAIPIITASGEVIIRYAPFKTEDAWIHPGFAKYGFLQKGIRKGRIKAAEYIIKAAVIPLLENADPLL